MGLCATERLVDEAEDGEGAGSDFLLLRPFDLRDSWDRESAFGSGPRCVRFAAGVEDITGMNDGDEGDCRDAWSLN